jgi:spore maturation protein CgeB
MRLFEATGVGAMLLTDRKDNLHELFEIGKEVVTYSSKEEAAELVRHYLDHPQEAEKIAKAGQARTLREHTYKARMVELTSILSNHL